MHRQWFESPYLRFRSQVVWQKSRAFIIDPGVLPRDGEKIQQFLKQQGLTVTHLLFTHTHGDHFACWQYFPSVTTAGGHAILDKPETRKTNDVRYVYSIWRKFQEKAPFEVTFPSLAMPLQDGQQLLWEDTTIYYFRTPGHATDHGVFICPEARWLFSGDMLIQIPQPFILQGFLPYYRSLHKLRHLIQEWAVETVIPAHGPELHGLPIILNQIERERHYIEAVVNKAHVLLQNGYSLETIQQPLLEAFALNGSVLHSHRVNVNTLLRELAHQPNHQLDLSLSS